MLMSAVVAAGCCLGGGWGAQGEPGHLGERQGWEKEGTESPGARAAHRRPREVKLARELLTYKASVIPDDKSPCKSIKDRVHE